MRTNGEHLTAMAVKNTFRFPRSSDRVFVCGQTGSGKTFGGVWVLSNMDIDARPWIVLDFKNDDLINGISKAQNLEYGDPLPTKPGIYILKCRPEDNERLHELFERILSRGDIGVYVDEGLVIGQNNAGFNACLTQGRSLGIPMIILSQRPVKCSTWILSESTFWMVFFLIKKSDREKVADDTPLPINYTESLEEHCSYWYDVKKRALFKLKPVPDEVELLARIDAKLPKVRRTL